MEEESMEPPVRGTCRSCLHGELQPILSLGEQYISDFVEEQKGVQAPLELVICTHCNLVQLKHTVDRGTLYRQYWYKSGVNEIMVAHLREIAAMATHLAEVHAGDKVVDIGCNDGTLLRAYPPEVTTIGFEPATNLVEEAQDGTADIINDFFSYEAWSERYDEEKARIVTAIAMFYDLEDPNKFLADVARVLAPDGLFIIQQNYLPTMLEKNAYDNISHEHLEYYSLMSLEPLLHRHGLYVVDVELNDINGGSFRTYIKFGPQPFEKNSVIYLRALEREQNLDRPEPYQEFQRRVYDNRLALRNFITREVYEGRTIYVYGPGNRGNVILQFCGLDHRSIRAAAERNPAKWGRRTVGTWIPIVSEEQMREDDPDYLLVLPWAFVENFVEREKEYLERGGQFIVPLPEFHLRRG